MTTSPPPSGAVWVVSSTSVVSTYLLVVVTCPTGRTDQCPAVSSSSRANTLGLSNRGKHSQSTEPSRLTSAAECRSESRACSAIARVLTSAPKQRLAVRLTQLG